MKNPILIYFFVSFFVLTNAQAQSLWSGNPEKMKGKSKKPGNKYIEWKDHVSNWGMDNDFGHAILLGVQLNTNGYGAGIRYISNKDNTKVFWQLRFTEIKHEKEIKLQNNSKEFIDLGENTPFILGKVNHAYTFHLAYGSEQILLPSLLNGNVSISLKYGLGPSLALLKPYYLNLIQVDYQPEKTSSIYTERYTIGNADKFLTPGYILGSARWSRGLDEIKLIPGLFAEAALLIVADNPKTLITAVSIGANVAVYTKKLEIMAETKAYPYQIMCFVGLGIGKKWKNGSKNKDD